MGKKKRNTALKAWLKSIRIWQLLGLMSAVMVMRYSFFGHSFHSSPLLESLFILPILLLSAGGNIINDYFDIKEDIAKRALIGRTLKRRVAMMSHWLLTGLGITLAILLSYLLESYIPAILAISTSVLLFLYSVWLKKKVLIGNFVIAGIATAYLPFSLCDVDMRLIGDKYDWFCCMIFTTILIHQIAKDIQDYKIDLKNGFRTFPIVFSSKSAWIFIYVIEIWLIFITYDGIKYATSLALQFLMGAVLIMTIFYSLRKKPQAVSAWVLLLLITGLAWMALYDFDSTYLAS